MSMNIQLEWTPNPSTIKYVVDQQLLASGAANFTSPEAAQGKSPLAEKLMEIEGVTGVMIGTNFVTITKGEVGDWDELNEAVMRLLDEHLSAGRPVVTAELRPAQNEGEDEIRPAVMNDGGDITLDHFEDGIVYLNMRGSCSGCPSSVLTLKMGIENRLREEIPEVNEVVHV